MSKSGGPVRPAPPISTKAELDRLKSARPKPTVETRLTIGGWHDTEVRRQVNTTAENRIKYLETRLDRARDKAKRGHRFANVRGRARSEFERGK